MTRKLSHVQSTVVAIQQGLQLKDDLLPVFFQQHFISLTCSAERVLQMLNAVAGLLEVPMVSAEMQEIVMICDERLFARAADQVCQSISFFCTQFGGGQQAAKAALKSGVFCMSKDSMQAHAAELQASLGWTDPELAQQVNPNPRLLCSKPPTETETSELQMHSFTPVQAQHLCASEPRLAATNWSSESNLDKLCFLLHVLRVTPDDITARPTYTTLGRSLTKQIGPLSLVSMWSSGP